MTAVIAVPILDLTNDLIRCRTMATVADTTDQGAEQAAVAFSPQQHRVNHVVADKL